MAGLESTSNQLGRIDVSQLVRPAEAVVEPRATAALTDAFRQGVITADDVISRIGELGKSREKADIMAAKEQVSPEAQALRAQQTAAGTAQAGLAEADALRKQVIQQYPAVAYFDALAPIAGIQQPMLPDGSPDYKKMEQIGAELAVHKARKDQAQAKRDNIVTEKSANGQVLFAHTIQGRFVEPEEVVRLDKVIESPFQLTEPGAVEMAPAAAAPAASVEPRGEDLETVRARLADKFGVESIQAMPESDVLRLAKSEGLPVIEPRAAASVQTVQPAVAAPAPAVPQVGAPAGGGISLGPPAAKPVTPEDPQARAQAIQAAQAILPPIDNAIAAVQKGGAVGPLAGSAPAKLFNRIAAAFGAREDQFKQQRDLEIAISSKILEGAQVMKGNLSDKDVRFLKDTVPNLADSEALWMDYLNRWKQMAQTNAKIIAGEIPKPSADLFAPTGYQPKPETDAKEAAGNFFAPPTASTSANKNPIITLKSGKRVQRDAAGIFQVVQ